MAFLMAPTLSKGIPLMAPLSLGKRNKSHRAISGEEGVFSSTEMFLSARNYRMLSPFSLVTFQTCPDLRQLSFKQIFYAHPTCSHSKYRPTIATHQLPYPFDVDLSPACWRPFAFESYFTPSLNLLGHSKACVRDMVSSPYTFREFFPTEPKISGLFIP